MKEKGRENETKKTLEQVLTGKLRGRNKITFCFKIINTLHVKLLNKNEIQWLW